MPSSTGRHRQDPVKFRSAPVEPSLRSRQAVGGRAAPRSGGRPAPKQREPLWKQVEQDEARRARARVRGRLQGQPKTLPGKRRFAVVYDLDGPRCTVGVVWFAATLAAVSIGVPAIAVLYGAVAAVAGWQVASAWEQRAGRPEPAAAAVGAAAITLAALAGLRAMGGAVLLLVVAALVLAWLDARSRTSIPAVAGLTVAAGLFPALAGVGVALTEHYEIGAAVTLVLLVAAYECGDYLVGSGASNRLEGPAAGILAIAVVALAAGVLRVPPFRGAAIIPFAAVAAVGCPLGQLFGSLLLPDARVRARALRRLDSLLLLGPAWAWIIGLYLH